MLLIIPNTRKKVGIPASISVAVAIGLSVMFKHIFSRPRPNILRLIEETGFSFPSAHAMLSAALYIMLIILVCKYLKSVLAKIVLVPCFSALILVVAYSRVYLGVHYITDIIGTIGFAITLVVYTVCRLTFLKIKNSFTHLREVVLFILQ
ncbi:MAG: phosphatase PAP2 family protein [Acutalibacteraceae bacterium]